MAYTSSQANSDIMKAVGQKFVDPKIEWFKLGNDSIAPLSGMKNYELYNTVTEPKSYAKAIMAPIQRTLDRIVGTGKEALLITDFEEFTPDGKEQMLGFGKDYFKRWLLAGNRITIFSNPYEEKTKDGRKVNKRLNFMVFSLGQGAANGLLDQFEKAITGTPMDSRFDLTNGSFKVRGLYPKEGVGGIYRGKEGKDDAANNVYEMNTAEYVNGVDAHGLPFEVYALDLPWSYVGRTHAAEDDKGIFLRDLWMNASGSDAYELKEIGVEVRDVTADLEHFAHCQEALLNTPKVIKDPDRGYMRIADDEENPVALYCYDSTGVLKPEWTYAPKERRELKEVFTAAEDLFRNGLTADPTKVELATAFHKEFDAEKLVDVRIVRVDLVVKATQDHSQDPALEKLKWPSATIPGKTNESLYYSIKETLQDPALAPERSNPLLYSYFILTAAPQ
ncbi:MAG: hypothetical protein IPI81_11045 [Flavobacteriales bacterium]|nr:hypothetical protein [Flavobacteriales bacterium]MCC6936776.1 hypothetical protein [Flavobacteriales bacterium]